MNNNVLEEVVMPTTHKIIAKYMWFNFNADCRYYILYFRNNNILDY